MKPIRVALVHRNSPRLFNRMVGWWSYEVPQFTWHHCPVRLKKPFTVDKDGLAENHDIIVYEDGKIGGTFTGSADIPICYAVVDSTLSEAHYQHRLQQADQCDLILLDWDRLERFEKPGLPPVERFNYCVNDKLFYPRGEKDIDIGSFQHTTPERREVDDWLRTFPPSRS